MAVITVVSGSGAPGVTTSCLALALAWFRPVLLVEADPAGSSAISAGWFRGQPPHDRGLLNLAFAQRQGALADALRDAMIPIPGSTVNVIAGIRSPAQAASMSETWEPLSDLLHKLEYTGTDVIVDGGRLGALGTPGPITRGSDAVLLATRTSLPAVAGARGWSTALREEFAALGQADRVGLLVVGEGRPYPAQDVSRSLGLPCVGRIAWDPEHAETYSAGKDISRRDLDRGSLSRSVRAAASGLHSMISDSRARLLLRDLTPAQEA